MKMSISDGMKLIISGGAVVPPAPNEQIEEADSETIHSMDAE